MRARSDDRRRPGEQDFDSLFEFQACRKYIENTTGCQGCLEVNSLIFKAISFFVFKRTAEMQFLYFPIKV